MNAMIAAAMTATPAITPPTIAPTGVEDELLEAGDAFVVVAPALELLDVLDAGAAFGSVMLYWM